MIQVPYGDTNRWLPPAPWHSSGSQSVSWVLDSTNAEKQTRLQRLSEPSGRPMRTMVARAGFAVVVALLVLSGFSRAEAIEELSVEEDISDLLPPSGDISAPEDAATRRWAILPQLGYGPDTGPVVGVKYTHRNLLHTGTTVDVDGTYAVLNQQEGLSLSVAQPHLFDDRFLTEFRLKFASNPQRDFFGLGNNEQGPDPASTNSFQDILGDITLGWRPLPSLALSVTVRMRKVNIGRGDRLDHCGSFSPCPFTVDAFPDLPGVHGGTANTIAASIVWNSRDSIVRPTKGWRGILKVVHSNKAFFSDFEFTRYIADLGYLRAFGDGRYVVGLRADGEWVDGPTSQVPYWELAELGVKTPCAGSFPTASWDKAVSC